ncbi:hypothetical protein HanPSC8_Chr05g0216001 [Helianthus annuus]|nr:hypothetical protein HanPSC8_Chr05g0216001 [Helianthus annuus]
MIQITLEHDEEQGFIDFAFFLHNRSIRFLLYRHDRFHMSFFTFLISD